MTTYGFNVDVVHTSWQSCIHDALHSMDQHYLTQLAKNKNWLPGPDKLFNAFSMPRNQVNYLLFGESPYPRRESANGYAFWDAAVSELWSTVGLSKRVNRATSLRNIMKMLLVADNALHPDSTNQEAIALVDKHYYVKTNAELFSNFINKGFLLLNATLVLQDGSPNKDAKAWYPFMRQVLNHLFTKNTEIELILFGRVANAVHTLLPDTKAKCVYAEHPYNHTFIKNETVLNFFRPFRLLNKTTN